MPPRLPNEREMREHRQTVALETMKRDLAVPRQVASNILHQDAFFTEIGGRVSYESPWFPETPVTSTDGFANITYRLVQSMSSQGNAEKNKENVQKRPIFLEMQIEDVVTKDANQHIIAKILDDEIVAMYLNKRGRIITNRLRNPNDTEFKDLKETIELGLALANTPVVIAP